MSSSSMIGSAYDSMQKPAFVFLKKYIERSLKKSVCVSKYRFLGSQPSLYKERGRSAKRGFVDYIRKLRTTQLHKRYTVDDGD
jgi:hypothetical protein